MGRDVSMPEVNKLAGSFNQSGIQRYSSDNLIPLVIPKSLILDVHTLASVLVPDSPPPLITFAPSATIIKLAGGQHRLTALKKYKTAFEDKRKEIEDSLKNEIGRKDGSEESSNKIAIWQLESTRMAKELEEYGFWGVVVYDEGGSSRSTFATNATESW
jgi:hypothetical protein